MSGIRVSETKRPPKIPKRPFSSGPVMKLLNRSFIARASYIERITGSGLPRNEQGQAPSKAIGTAFRNAVPSQFELAWTSGLQAALIKRFRNRFYRTRRIG